MPPICGKFAIKQSVRVEIARWAQRTFDDVAVEIGDHKLVGLEAGVIDAAGLDDHEGLDAKSVDAAGVPKGVGREAAARDFLVGVEHLFAKGFEEHGVSLEQSKS